MPRIRSIKPEIVSDVALAKVSIPARYTFVLLISQADDIGLIAGAHRQLLGNLFPLDDAVSIGTLLTWLEELVSVGLLRWLATRDGVPVLQIVKWAKHQRIDNAGRSQLGALLAESPADLPHAHENGVPSAEFRGGSPQVAATRGESPLGPTTTDLGPRTTDLGPPTTDQIEAAAIALSVRANQGLADHHTRPQPIPRIIGTSGASHAAAETILGAGVPLAFAEQRVYELAVAHTADGTVRSLKYFTDAVIRAWLASQEGERSNGPRPAQSEKSLSAGLRRIARGANG